MKTLAVLFLVAGLAFGAFAHGDLHEQIEDLTREIKKNPKNADLYQRRGELHRVHEEWSRALADYEVAEKLNPGAPIDFLKGRLYYERRDLSKAVEHLNRFIEKNPNTPEPRLYRARTLRDLKEYQKATEDYDIALKLTSRPQPESYIERARAAVLANPRNIDSAIAGLEEGLKNLGPIITLELEAIDIEVAAGKYDSALARVEKIINRSPRKEKWLVQRGEIQLKAGKRAEAKQSFESAIAAIQKLPPQHRNTKAMVNLEKSARENLSK